MRFLLVKSATTVSARRSLWEILEAEYERNVERHSCLLAARAHDSRENANHLFSLFRKEGMTTPIRVAPASRRALAHRAAASISCFAESKAARETVGGPGIRPAKKRSPFRARRGTPSSAAQDVERVGDNEFRRFSPGKESLQCIRQPRGIEVVLGFLLVVT